jgi:hypothetical protein
VPGNGHPYRDHTDDASSQHSSVRSGQTLAMSPSSQLGVTPDDLLKIIADEVGTCNVRYVHWM